MATSQGWMSPKCNRKKRKMQRPYRDCPNTSGSSTIWATWPHNIFTRWLQSSTVVIEFPNCSVPTLCSWILLGSLTHLFSTGLSEINWLSTFVLMCKRREDTPDRNHFLIEWPDCGLNQALPGEKRAFYHKVKRSGPEYLALNLSIISTTCIYNTTILWLPQPATFLRVILRFPTLVISHNSSVAYFV